MVEEDALTCEVGGEKEQRIACELCCGPREQCDPDGKHLHGEKKQDNNYSPILNLNLFLSSNHKRMFFFFCYLLQSFLK